MKKEIREIVEWAFKRHPGVTVDQATIALIDLFKKEINDIANMCMYDFPKSYNNSQIQAYQKGIEKIWSTLIKRLGE